MIFLFFMCIILKVFLLTRLPHECRCRLCAFLQQTSLKSTCLLAVGGIFIYLVKNSKREEGKSNSETLWGSAPAVLTPFSDHTSALHNNGTFRRLGVISRAFGAIWAPSLQHAKKKERNMHLNFVALTYCSICLEKKQQYKKKQKLFFVAPEG